MTTISPRAGRPPKVNSKDALASGKVRVQTYLTPERKRQLAVYCFEHDVTMAEVLEEAVERYLREDEESDAQP